MAENIYTLRLLDIVPSSLQGDEQVRAATQAVDAEFRRLAKGEIRNSLILPRLDELPVHVVDLLAWQWHVDFYDEALSLERKRNLIRRSIAWHRIKGTPSAVEEVVKAAYGNCTLTEWFEYGGKPYFFRVAVTLEEESTDKKRWKNVIAAIQSVKNARSWMEEILFYYPAIILPIPIEHTNQSMQYVRADHCVWNLGAARSTYWDGEFCWDGTIRYDGIYPDELYRERQLHTAKIIANSRTTMPIAVKHNHRIYGIGGWQQPVDIKHENKINQVVKSNQATPIKNAVKPTQAVDLKQKTSCRYTNMWDGSFCWDGSHTWAGVQESANLITHACSVRTISKNGTEGVRETI